MNYKLQIHGKTPLLQNNKNRMFTAPKGRRKVQQLSPSEEAPLCAYPVNGHYAHPTIGLRRGILEAAKGYKVGKQAARLQLGAAMDLEPVDWMILTDSKGNPLTKYAIREDIYTNPSTGGRVIGGRPMWEEWHLALTMTLDERFWPKELMPLLNDILTDAGLKQGLGDYRPGSPKNPGLGTFGKFTFELEEVA